MKLLPDVPKYKSGHFHDRFCIFKQPLVTIFYQ